MGGGAVGEESGKGKRKRNSGFPQEAGTEEPKRTRVHAQRKFAQGAGGASPHVSPLKEVRSRTKADNGSSSSSTASGPSFPTQKGSVPKTEDFLTFLCLRGTDVLPPELDFFNHATNTQGHESSEESFSDQDDVNKDPEVDKNGVAKKSTPRRLAKEGKTKKEIAVAAPSLKKKESDLKLTKEDKKSRKARSGSQDSASSPERKVEPRTTRSQVDQGKQNAKSTPKKGSKEKKAALNTSNRESRALARQLQKPDSSDESSSEHEQTGGRKSQLQKSESEADADEEASSRESSRRPNSRRSEEVKVRGKDTLSRLKAREGRSTSRDSSGSKESLNMPRPVRGSRETAKSFNLESVKSEEIIIKEKIEPESADENGADNGCTLNAQDSKDDISKSPKEKKEKKKDKKHKNKNKNSLKDLQNILLEEAKRNIAEPQTAMKGETPKGPSTSPEDSEGNSDDRITISQKTGYISVKPRTSMDQVSEDGSAGSKSPQRRNSGALSRVKSTDRVPTPPRKILPKGNSAEPQRSTSESPVSNRPNHLPAGVIGAAGLSNRLAQPMTSKAQAMVTSAPYTSPASASTYSQPLIIQTSMASSQAPVLQTSMSSLPATAAAQPTIIMPGQQVRMPLQMSAVPIVQGVGIRPGAQVITSGNYPGMAGIPILGPAGMQFGIPVQGGQVQMRPQTHQAVVTVPTFIRSGFTYGQPIIAGPTSQQQGVPQMQQQLPQTITMPSGTTIQYNVPPTSIRQSGLPQSKPASTASSSFATASNVISTTTATSPLVSPGPPTLSPQIAGQRSPPTTVVTPNLTTKLGNGPPTLTPPVRKEEPRARKALDLKPQRSAAVGHGSDTNLAQSGGSEETRVPTTASPLASDTSRAAVPSQSPRGQPALQSPPHEPLQAPQPLYSPYAMYSGGPPSVQGFPAQTSPGYPQTYHSPNYPGQPSPQGSYHSSHSPGLYMSPPALHISSPPHGYQTGYPQAYPMSPVQYNQYNQASQPPAQAQPVAQPLHSPLTHSSASYRSQQPDGRRGVPGQKTEPKAAKRQPEEVDLAGTDQEEQDPISKHDDEGEEEAEESGEERTKAETEDLATSQPSSSWQTPTKTDQQPGPEGSSSGRKKAVEKQITSKLGDSRNRLIKPMDVEDNSSPYAFDFEGPESDAVPFRKSSSPLKPQALIKKSAAKSQKEHADLKPTGSGNKKLISEKLLKQDGSKPNIVTSVKPDKPLEIKCDMDNSVEDSKPPENHDPDASSSDNETTYFIPLQNSTGQSFGVAVKLGTDGPSGPNQKVIMTAKLVTSPNAKPTKAKILGAKTTENPKPAEDPVFSPGQSTSTPSRDESTPRKIRMPNASPVEPNRLMDDDSGGHLYSSPAKPRMRRALSPDSGRSSGSQANTSQANTSQSGKKRPMCLLGQVNTGHRFPRLGQHAEMMEAPTFRPTEAEFKDPLRYIQKIRSYAEQFGMCRIIPPKTFKPECNVDDDMRFTGYNQYVNRMFSRWGPNAKETAAIKKYLETQNVDTRAHPLVGGLEVDLPALYHAVQSFGGLGEVIQKKKWPKIAEYLRVSRGSNSNMAGNKLDDIYVKWLLPYDTLSAVEREELLRLVEEEWAEQSRDKAKKTQNKENGNDADEEEEEEEDEDQEAVVKGKATSLTAFYRLATNLMKTVFRNEEPPHYTVEDEYWKIVGDKDVHMQVSQGSIDTGMEGFGFPIRNSPFATHPWNLKVLTKNSRSILRAMGSVMGVTQPTLHVGMLFTTGCWYRDPHGLPWIEYLHTGAPKIWYGIPDDHSLAFYTAMKQLVPSFCKNQKIWLPSDTTMVCPSLLVKHGVSVCRAVQQPGQFVVVFPKSYTSSICTGYCVSESVYYAPADWLRDVDHVFQDIKDSMEPMMFPLEKMLFALSVDVKSTKYVLEAIRPKVNHFCTCHGNTKFALFQIEKIREREARARKEVISLGIKVRKVRDIKLILKCLFFLLF